ncbi:MAG: hypothetical protein K0S12_1370 [Bacteroidetes bacterium]|nr:hypothetical protein [Bacteroidota bacterium]
MKQFFIFLGLFTTLTLSSQEHLCSKAKMASAKAHFEHQQRTSALLPNISHELKYDVKFVHLMLNLERTTKYVGGGVKTVASVSASSLDTFACLLHENHTIDSIRFNGTRVCRL